MQNSGPLHNRVFMKSCLWSFPVWFRFKYFWWWGSVYSIQYFVWIWLCVFMISLFCVTNVFALLYLSLYFVKAAVLALDAQTANSRRVLECRERERDTDLYRAYPAFSFALLWLWLGLHNSGDQSQHMLQISENPTLFGRYKVVSRMWRQITKICYYLLRTKNLHNQTNFTVYHWLKLIT